MFLFVFQFLAIFGVAPFVVACSPLVARRNLPRGGD